MKSNRGLALFTMKSVRASVTWRLVVFLVICFAVNENFSAEETRVWKTADGKFSVEAEFVNIEDDVVRLRRADNNRSASVPVEMLSRSDRKYIQKRIEQGMDSSRLKYRRAAWMEGQWGFRFNMPGMKQPEALAEFDVQKMIDQIKVLDTASWVQINLTQGANGSFYTSPHPELAKHVSPDIELIEKNNEINGSLGHFFRPCRKRGTRGNQHLRPSKPLTGRCVSFNPRERLRGPSLLQMPRKRELHWPPFSLNNSKRLIRLSRIVENSRPSERAHEKTTLAVEREWFEGRGRVSNYDFCCCCC